MTTISEPWKEWGRHGTGKRVMGKTLDVKIENPYVGVELQNFLDAVEGDAEGWYGLAHLLEEYGGEALEDIEEMSEDELAESVVAIEERIAEERGVDR